LVQVYFESNQQAERFMQIIPQKLSVNQAYSFIRYNRSNSISIVVDEEDYYEMAKIMCETFMHFIYKEVLSQWISQIVREKFFYEEPEEYEQIVDIALAIMEEDHNKGESFWSELRQKMSLGLMTIFERKVSFSFPSFVMFRMKGVVKKLIPYVETAIDEYKMEQEYQRFVHMLRNFMLSVTCKVQCIHMTFKGVFQFYDEQFRKMERGQIERYIDRRLFSDYPMYIDSNVLAPLISIAPKQLYIYSDEENHPLLLTIQRIFEERVQILPEKIFKQKSLQENRK